MYLHVKLTLCWSQAICCILSVKLSNTAQKVQYIPANAHVCMHVHIHTDINLRGVHVLIADTIASGSLNQMGPLAGYIIHYHKSDAPTQTGAAWIIKGRYISTCVEVCVWADVIEQAKSTTKTPPSTLNSLMLCTSDGIDVQVRKRRPTSPSSPSECNQNREAWKKRRYLWDTAPSGVRPLFCCVVLSLVVELVPLSEPERVSQVTLTL